MKIVVDSNRIIASLLKDSTTREILYNDEFEFFAPEFVMEEIGKYKAEFINKGKITEDKFEALLPLLFERVALIPQEEYAKQLKRLEKAISDPKDIPHNVKNAILAEANVDFQVSQVIGYGRELFEKGQLLVAGFMRDIDGTYGSRFGDCYLININGETNPERMRTNAYLKALPENMLSEKVRRME